ncbi:MAG: hypothetical protein EBR51_12585 [Gammaproteobacteria bacterium]|jgi:hypothetical protein|nr:hypothetical protein [Gammaproteobacteria bacterium]
MALSARELIAAIAAEADNLTPLILWHLHAVALPSQHALRQAVADAFIVALHELGALHITRSVAEIRVAGGSSVYEHMHARFPPETILAAASAFQRACSGPLLIGQSPYDWETRGSWTYALTDPGAPRD